MIRRILTGLAAAAAIGALLLGAASPAAASTACNGSSSCDETLVTQNNAAQFILNSYNCISTTNHDIDGVTVYNNASDGQQHTYKVQARQELPSNSLIVEKTISVAYHHSVNVQMGIASRPKGNHLYTYVRDGNGVEQRLSVWHAEGDYPTWATATTLIYPYNTYACT